jgi:hypothetical protein
MIAITTNSSIRVKESAFALSAASGQVGMNFPDLPLGFI